MSQLREAIRLAAAPWRLTSGPSGALSRGADVGGLVLDSDGSATVL